MALCRAHPKWLRHEPALNDRAKLAAAYQEARGVRAFESTRIFKHLGARGGGLRAAVAADGSALGAQRVWGGRAVLPAGGHGGRPRGISGSFYDAAPALPPAAAAEIVAGRGLAVARNLPKCSGWLRVNSATLKIVFYG